MQITQLKTPPWKYKSFNKAKNHNILNTKNTLSGNILRGFFVKVGHNYKNPFMLRHYNTKHENNQHYQGFTLKRRVVVLTNIGKVYGLYLGSSSMENILCVNFWKKSAWLPNIKLKPSRRKKYKGRHTEMGWVKSLKKKSQKKTWTKNTKKYEPLRSLGEGGGGLP